MGKPKPAVTTTQGTSTQQYDQRANQAQRGTSSGQVAGLEFGQESGRTVGGGYRANESQAQRQQREAQEARSRSEGRQVGTGTSRDFTAGRQYGTSTSRGLTEQQQENITRSSGGSQNQYGWAERPDTADTSAFREAISKYEGVQDPTISFNAANQREQVLRMAQNPLGAYTTPETRQASTAAALGNIAQQEGQAYLQDAFNRSQQKLQAIGMQGQLAQMTQPLRELLGTQQTQEQVGTGTTRGTADTVTEQDMRTEQERTGQTTSDLQTQQDTISNTLSELFGTDTTRGTEISSQFQDFMRENLGINLGTSESQEESSGESSATGTSSGTQQGTSTYQPPQPNIWGQVLGGAASAAAII